MGIAQLQGEDIKKVTDVTSPDRLPNDDKFYLNSKSKTLKQALDDGDIGTSYAKVVTNNSSAIYNITESYDTLFKHNTTVLATYNLPSTINVGIRYGFFNMMSKAAPSNIAFMRIAPATGHKIVYRNNVVENPGYISINRFGCTITLLAIDSTTWAVYSDVSEQFRKNIVQGDGYSDISLVGRNVWIAKGPSGTARQGTGGFSLNGYGYNCCGSNQASIFYNEVNQYNEASGLFTTLSVSSALSQRGDVFGMAFNGRGYIVTGYDTGTFNWQNQSYNDASNLWSVRANHPTAKRYSAGEVLNGYGYCLGGMSGPGALAEVHQYSDSSDGWTVRSSMLTGNRGLAPFSLNGYIYTVNGYDGSVNISASFQYNDSANSWLQRSSALPARRYPGGFSINGYGYTVGGLSTPWHSDTNQYNDSANIWETKAFAGSLRQCPATFAINGYGYSCSGSGAAVSSYVEQYN